MHRMDIEVSELSDYILGKLRDSGQWMTRKQIADAMGRPGRLNPYDVQLLNELVETGLVETDQRKIGVVRTELIYRAKS